MEWASGDDIDTEEIEDSLHGGREFKGFQTIYLDQLEVAGAIQEQQLQQQVAIQEEIWDARRRELEYKEGQWEAKMQTILSRGNDQWAAAENAFLTRWHDAKSAEEASIAAAEEKWKQRIADHHAEKLAWEEEMRRRLAEKTLEEDLGTAIDDLNAQIRSNRDSMNADLPTIDRQSAINEAIDKLSRQSLNKENLESVNQSIEDFDTNIQLQMRSRELGAENIYDVTKDFHQNIDRHKDNMQVMAKVQILEEYRNLIDEFVKSIERQNEAYKEQTRVAALSAGYVEMGSIFIKKGLGSKNVGVINPINLFDIHSRAEDFKETSQIYASEADFNRLMESASLPEFEAILHTEKLRAQKWMQDISGTATDQETRRRTKECEELGDFGCWIGRAPDGMMATLAVHMAGKDVSSFSAANDHAGVAVMLQKFAGGLGEMGAESRPGQPGMPGFYLQMKFMNEQVSKKNQANIEGRGPFIDPLSGALNKVTLGPAQALHNVEVGTKVHGRDRGKLTRANFGEMGKSGLQVGALALDCAFLACAPVFSGIAGAINAQIHIDTQRGGSQFKVTDESAIAGVAGLTTAAIGGAHAADLIRQAAMQTASRTVSAVSSGLQAGVSEYKREGSAGLALVRGLGTGYLSANLGEWMGGSGGGGSSPFLSGVKTSLAQSLIMDAANSSWELGRKSAGMDNYYMQSITPSIQSFSSTVGGAISAGISAHYAAQHQSAKINAAIEKAAERSSQEGANRELLLEILIGVGGIRRKDAETILGSMENQISKNLIDQFRESRNIKDTSIKRTADVIAALVAGKASEQGRGGKVQAANQLAVKLLKSGMPEGEVMSEVSRKMGVNLHEMGTSSHLGAIRSAEQQWYDSMQPGEGDPGTTYTFETVNLGPGMQTNILVEKPNFLVPESEEDGAPPTLEERILGTDWNQVEMDNLAANGKLPEKGKIVYYPSGEKGIVTFSYDGAVEVTTKRGTIRFSLESDDPGHEFWMKFRDPGTEHSIEMDRLRNQWATENGMTGEELGRTSASIGVGLIPVVGTLQSAVELVSGRDYITGEKVHRGIAAAGLLLGLVPGGKGALKFATKVYQKGGFKLLAKAGPRLMKKLAQVSGPGALKALDKTGDQALQGPRGLVFVGENLGKPTSQAMQRARDFESGTSGAFSLLSTKQRVVPGLVYNNDKINGKAFIKFDGFRILDNGVTELIDAKTRIVPFSTKAGPFISPSVKDSLGRQSRALAQNLGYKGVIEVPSVEAMHEAISVLDYLGIKNITVRVRR